jgi:hypothetical protein
MRLSCLVVVVLLVAGSIVFAQHSSAGASASFSAGGSHGGSVGSSSASYSSSSHSSGPSAPHSSGSQLAHLTPSTQSGLNMRQTALKPNTTATGAQAEKKGFFSHLWHPSRRSAPMLETSLRFPVCQKQPCVLPICRRGQSLNGKGACAATNLGAISCQAGNYLSTGACAALLPDDCRGLPLALNRLALIQDEQARQAKRDSLQRQYARCQQLLSLFSPYWAGNLSGNFF